MMLAGPTISTVIISAVFSSKKNSKTDIYNVVPNILGVCHDSRIAALQVYRLMECRVQTTVRDDLINIMGYLNMLYGRFKFAPLRWFGFRVLARMMLRYPLPDNYQDPLYPNKGLQYTISIFATIRYALVDINTFAKLPLAVWSLFTNLEVLTIGFYPLDRCSLTATEIYGLGDDPDLVKPPPNTLFGHRATWLCKEVTRIFRSVSFWEQYQLRPLSLSIEVEMFEPNRETIRGTMFMQLVHNMVIDEKTSMSRDIFSRRLVPLQDDEAIEERLAGFPTQDVSWYQNFMSLIQAQG